MTTTAKINKLVRDTVGPAKIIWRPSGFANSQTLRVVTSAWRRLPREKRVSRLEQAIQPKLNAKERARIFRISVLTPAEFKRLAQMVPEPVLFGTVAANGRA